MSLIRYQIMYPDCLFRARIIFKNVALPDDRWAEGALCINSTGSYSIINRKCGNGAYSMNDIFIDTLGMASGFNDGLEKDIFEGDIIRIKRFAPLPGTLPEEKSEEEQTEEDNLFEPEGDIPEEENKEDGDEYVRRFYADVPEGYEAVSNLEGVVFMSEGVFYIQYFDFSCGTLSCVPLYMFFGYDMLPGENTAVKVIGNMYDDEELYSKVLGMSFSSPPSTL